MQHFIQSARIATMGWKLVGKNGFLENPDEGWTSPSLRTLYANMLTEQRLGIVYRVVNMLVYFDPMAMCDLPSDLILAPLPAKKQLWKQAMSLCGRPRGRERWEPKLPLDWQRTVDLSNWKIVSCLAAMLGCRTNAWRLGASREALPAGRSGVRE